MQRWIPGALVAFFSAAFAAFAAPASAQDYTLTTTSGQHVTVPSSGTTEYTFGDDTFSPRVDLPFAMPYYGTTRSYMYIASNGYLQLGPAAVPPTNSSYSNTTISNTAPARSGNTDCSVAAWWEDLNPNLSTTERIGWFVTGTAPNRVVVVFWDNVPQYGNAANLASFQVHLYETTGRVVLAYPAAAWAGAATPWSANVYFMAGGSDNRFSAPFNTTTNAKPSVDYRFDPKETLFTGSVSLQAFASDATGLGNSTVSIPAAGLGVDLRSTTGATLATGSLAADGTFQLRGLALNSTGTGTIHVATSSLACRVAPSTSSSTAAPYSLQIASNVSFASNLALSPVVVNDTNDASGAFRRPAQIAAAVGRASAWVRARTSDAIGTLEVFYDNASSETTRWVDGSLPYLRIGGAASGNQDAFDVATVMRGYARLLVRSMTGATTGTQSLALDARGDGVGAMADGLGLYLYALIEQQTKAYDGTSSSTTTVFDLETPVLSTARGPDVGGWFGAAMYDLVDAANEPHDLIDGTVPGGAERPFAVFDTLTSLSLVDFVLEWNARGYDSASLVKVLVHHGVLSDDTDEPDDTPGLARDLGTAGVRLAGRTLNPFNEDWYRITPAAATDSFYVDVVYDRSATDATVVLEVIGASGILATGSFNDATGPLRAVTPAIAAGTPLQIRLAHVAGGHVGTYAIQAYGRLNMSTVGPFAWTVGRPLNQPLQINGGIAPFTIAVKQGTLLPSGIALDSANSRVVGTPLDEGSTAYALVVSDSGNPQNTQQLGLTLDVNAPLAFTAPLLTGVALGKTTDVTLGRSGGTPPIAITDFVGQIPTGLDLSADFHIQGTTNAAGGGRLSFVATDVAGSSATVDTTLVSCARLDGGKMAIDLGAGDAAGGFYFDAVAGTAINVTLTTAKKRAPRDLTVLVVGPDGRAVEGGTVKVTRGKALLKDVLLPDSGRYFFVFSSRDGGPATQLAAAIRTVLPKKGSGSALYDFGDAVTLDFGALDGTQLTLTGKTTLGMNLRVAFLIRPDGTVYPAAGVLEIQRNGRFKFTMRLDQSGTWTLVLGHKPGPVGEVAYTYAFKHARGAGYSID
jgi:hypothetical protein